MKVTNNTANPLVIGSTHIDRGATEEVAEWDAVKDSFAVKKFLEAEAISTSKAAAATKQKSSDADDRKAVIAELDKLKAPYKQDATTPELLVLLDEAKKKAGQA